MSISEASEFWDEHSLLEFEGTEEVEVEFKLKKKRYIGLAPEAFKRLETLAKKKKMSPEALLEFWISEKTQTV